MAQRNKHNPGLSARLSRWQTVGLLCLFLVVRGLVPAGFMPGSLAAGTPYALCHGDARSSLLLQSLARLAPSGHTQHHTQPHAHHHDAATAQAFADNHCSFSAGAALSAAPAINLDAAQIGVAETLPSATVRLATRPSCALPHSRAPPSFPFA